MPRPENIPFELGAWSSSAGSRKTGTSKDISSDKASRERISSPTETVIEGATLPCDIERGFGFKDPADVGPSVFMSLEAALDDDEQENIDEKERTLKPFIRRQRNPIVDQDPLECVSPSLRLSTSRSVSEPGVSRSNEQISKDPKPLLVASSPPSVEGSPGPLPPPLRLPDTDGTENDLPAAAEVLSIVSESPFVRSAKKQADTSILEAKSSVVVNARPLRKLLRPSLGKSWGTVMPKKRESDSLSNGTKGSDGTAVGEMRTSTGSEKDTPGSSIRHDGPSRSGTGATSTGLSAGVPPARPTTIIHLNSGSDHDFEVSSDQQGATSFGQTAKSSDIPSSTRASSSSSRSADNDRRGPKEGVPYKYQEVVRNKEQRKKMHAEDCSCCTGVREKSFRIKK